MANHKLNFLIKASDIQKRIKDCKDVVITNATIMSNGELDIECIVSDVEIVKHDNSRYVLFSCENEGISLE